MRSRFQSVFLAGALLLLTLFSSNVLNTNVHAAKVDFQTQDYGGPYTLEQLAVWEVQYVDATGAEINPTIDDLSGSMMVVIEWPTACGHDGTQPIQFSALLAISCGEERTYQARFIGECTEDGKMAGAVTAPSELPLREFACYPIPSE